MNRDYDIVCMVDEDDAFELGAEAWVHETGPLFHHELRDLWIAEDDGYNAAREFEAALWSRLEDGYLDDGC